MESSPPIHDLDLRAPQFAKNPYPTYKMLRASLPVCQLQNGTYLLSRYDDVSYALRNHHLFSSGWSDAPIIHPSWLSDECRRGAFLPELDPPLHTTYREIVKKSFSKKSADNLAATVEKFASDLVQKIRRSNKRDIEILGDFAYPLASSVIDKITGLNTSENISGTLAWIELLESLTSDCPAPEKKAEIEALIINQNIYYDELIKSRRDSPKDDLATVLAHASLDGKPLPIDQLRSALNLFTIGGFEAPAQLLANCILFLSQRPDLKHTLLTEPEKLRVFIEEMARLYSAAQGSMRVTRESIPLHGKIIPKNSVVLALTGSANRDPHQFTDPDELLLNRNNIKSHLGFGQGAHVCIGAALARLEVSIGLRTFLVSFSEYKCPDESSLEWYSTPVGRVLKSLNTQLPIAA